MFRVYTVVGLVLGVLFLYLLVSATTTRLAKRRLSPYERPAPDFPEYDRPGRAAGLTPESDEEFLRRIRERAEEQRRKADEKKPKEEGGTTQPEAGS